MIQAFRATDCWYHATSLLVLPQLYSQALNPKYFQLFFVFLFFYLFLHFFIVLVIYMNVWKEFSGRGFRYLWPRVFDLYSKLPPLVDNSNATPVRAALGLLFHYLRLLVKMQLIPGSIFLELPSVTLPLAFTLAVPRK